MPATYLSSLPTGVTASALAVDPAGNFVIVGGTQAPGPSQDAFLAKLTPDGKTLLFYRVFGGSAADAAVALAVDGTGNVFVAGSTQSNDFPTTEGALETGLNGANAAGFVMKVDPSGKIVYSSLFGGSSGERITITALAINAAEEVFLTGTAYGGIFITTPGTFQSNGPLSSSFIARLSAGGDRLIYSVAGLGGTSIVIDTKDNAIVQGVFASSGQDIPVTPGAYQTTAPFTICAFTMAFGFPCGHQYVAKLDSAGSTLLFCTYVTGSAQDEPAGLAVDLNGDIYLAGTTGSTDYPVTPGAAQERDTVQLPPNPIDVEAFFGFAPAFPYTGYVTKLSGDGTHLSYSTFVGGSQSDFVTALAVDSHGQATVSLRVQSPNFPGLPSAPIRCLPDRLHDLPVVVTLDAKGSTLTSTVIVNGVSPGANQQGLAIDGSGGAYLLITGPYLANTRATASDAITCVTDTVDYSSSGVVSPGQMVTIFGTALGSAMPELYDPKSPALPTLLGGASVLVNGQAAPLVYVSKNQINFVVPYEVYGQPAATVQVLTANATAAQRTMAVAPLTPTLNNTGSTAYPICQGGTLLDSVTALVLNEDGSQNSCDNPAQAGSLIRVFLNGTGINLPGSTGEVPQNPVPITPFVSAVGLNVERTVSAPGAPLGSWEADIRLSSVAYPYHAALQLSVGGVPVRENNVAVWIAH